MLFQQMGRRENSGALFLDVQEKGKPYREKVEEYSGARKSFLEQNLSF